MDERRREQMREAKARQRAREREAGLTSQAVRLPAPDAERLREGMRDERFERKLRELLDASIVPLADYPNVAALQRWPGASHVSREDLVAACRRDRRFLVGARLNAAERQVLEDVAGDTDHV